MNEPAKFRTKNWVEISGDARGRYNTNGQIKFKNSKSKSVLCDYSDAYILVSGTITISALATGRVYNDIEVVFKNCAPFTDCISKINNTQIDNVKVIDAVMPMYNLIQYNNDSRKIMTIL